MYLCQVRLGKIVLPDILLFKDTKRIYNIFMKKLLLGLLISGTVIFLLLPAVFDEEEQKKEQPKTAFENAVSFNPDDGEGGSLPVFEGRKKDNIFKTYSKRFKRMYGRALLNSPVQEAQETQYARSSYNTSQDEDTLSLAMAFLLADDGERIRQVRSSRRVDSAQQEINAVTYDSYDDSYLPVKQTVHDNAPVKGLYESSSVEPPESRVKAKQVYSNVMSKFEKTPVPQKSAPSAAANTYEEQPSSFGGWTLGTESKSGSASSARGAAASGARSSFSYTYGGNSAQGNSGGKYSYYRYNTVKKLSSGLLPDFETVAALTESKLKAAVTRMGEEAQQKEEEQQKEDEHSKEDKPLPPAEDTVFDPEKYDTEMPVCSALEEETPKEETDKIDTCDSSEIGSAPLNENITKADILIDVGSSKDGLLRITPTGDSTAGLGLSYIGIDSFISGNIQIDENIKTFKGITTQDFDTVAKNPKSIVITTSPAMAEKYVGKAVLIEQGSLETKSGLKTLADKLNNIKEETARIQSEIDKRNAAAAAAKQSAQEQNKQAIIQDITQGLKGIASSEEFQ